MDLKTLEKASLKTIKHKFMQLEPMSESFRYGFLKVQFIGPWWLRKSAMPSIHLSGLPGWQGKLFLDPDHATNILKIKDKEEQRYTMQCVELISLVDAKPSVVLNYGAAAPIPWRWVIDELRILDENNFLCMTVINLPILRHFSFPFILSR